MTRAWQLRLWADRVPLLRLSSSSSPPSTQDERTKRHQGLREKTVHTAASLEHRPHAETPTTPPGAAGPVRSRGGAPLCNIDSAARRPCTAGKIPFCPCAHSGTTSAPRRLPLCTLCVPRRESGLPSAGTRAFCRGHSFILVYSTRNLLDGIAGAYCKRDRPPAGSRLCSSCDRWLGVHDGSVLSATAWLRARGCPFSFASLFACGYCSERTCA